MKHLLCPQTNKKSENYTNDKRASVRHAALQKRKGTMCRRLAGYAAPKVSLYQRVLATARPERAEAMPAVVRVRVRVWVRVRVRVRRRRRVRGRRPCPQ